MTKETNEGATPTANTAASTTNTAAQQATTEQGNAAAEQAAPTTQTSSKPQAASATTTAAQPQPTAATATAQQRTATTPPPLPTQQPETADSLKAQLTALQARLDAIETQRTTEARTAEIERIIAPLNDTLKAVYRRTAYTALPEEDYKTLRSTIQAEVAELEKNAKAQGAVFGRPTESISSGSKASDKETAEVIGQELKPLSYVKDSDIGY